MRLLGFLALSMAVCACAQARAIVGLDHIPTAVKDLEAASARYRALGFVLKPGRPHDNSILNRHAKYPDGSGIELITASEPRDTLAARYLRDIASGDGPAYLALHTADFAGLRARLRQASIEFEEREFFTLKNPGLRYVFFGGSNRSPTDRPEHFAHANGTTALIGVWLADAENFALRELLSALGAKLSTGRARLPRAGDATFAELDNGVITLLPKSARHIDDRPIIGAVLATRDIDVVLAQLRAARLDREAQTVETDGYRSLVLPPTVTHGLWLEFRQRLDGAEHAQ